MPRSPQADNWLRTVRPLKDYYTVAIVPSALVEGFTRFFDNSAAFKRSYKVMQHRYQSATIAARLHPAVYEALQKDQDAFVQTHPTAEGVFDRLQHLVFRRANGRPFPRRYDERELLRELDATMAAAPLGPNSYANAVRYNINGVVTTLPILNIHMVVQQSPVPMRPLD